MKIMSMNITSVLPKMTTLDSLLVGGGPCSSITNTVWLLTLLLGLSVFVLSSMLIFSFSLMNALDSQINETPICLKTECLPSIWNCQVLPYNHIDSYQLVWTRLTKCECVTVEIWTNFYWIQQCSLEYYFFVVIRNVLHKPLLVRKVGVGADT